MQLKIFCIWTILNWADTDLLGGFQGSWLGMISKECFESININVTNDGEKVGIVMDSFRSG